MGAPEGYVALDLVGFTDKGDYDAAATYMINDLVHLNNDVWCCLKDGLTGIAPVQGEDWKIFIKGTTTAEGVTAVDTSGLVGGSGEVVIAQELLDVISDAVMNKLVTKTMMSGVQVNSADMVPTSALMYELNQAMTQNAEAITELNSNMTYTDLTEGFDLNNALGKYRAYSSSIFPTLSNLPSGVTSGEIAINWVPITSNNNYGMQLLFRGSADVIYFRSKMMNTWTKWKVMNSTAL